LTHPSIVLVVIVVLVVDQSAKTEVDCGGWKSGGTLARIPGKTPDDEGKTANPP
jgi:hypothetical protein